MKRKLCSVLLALCMVLTLLPVSAMADEADTQSATSLPAADENGVITLMENVTLTSTFVVNAEQDLTLDLNGYSLTKAGTVILNNGRLTIRDTTKMVALFLLITLPFLLVIIPQPRLSTQMFAL